MPLTRRTEESRKLLGGSDGVFSSSDEKYSDSDSVGKQVKYNATLNCTAQDFDIKTGWFQNFPTRYVLSILAFLGFVNVYALRVNLNVAIVTMVKFHSQNSTANTTVECPDNSYSNSSDIEDRGEFEWDGKTQGLLLGAFFYGYIVTQIPGGRLAEIIGTKWLFGGGVMITSVLTLLSPFAARLHVSAFIALRILEGLGEGVTFPAMHAMLARWMPKSERGIQSTFIYSGAQIGTVIAMPISGYLCDSDFLGGWPAVFYIFGFTGCVWFIFWVLLIHQTPADHPRITKEELLYIEESQGDEKCQMKPKIPWRSILTSMPVWALVVCHFGQNWGFYTFLTELPSYMNNIMRFDVKKTGFYNALPYLLQAIVGWVTAYAADIVRKKQIVSTSVIRKVCNTISFIGPAVCLFGVIMAGCNHNLSLALLIIALGFNGFSYPGFMVTHVDMSPDFAGTLMGITNCIANIAGFLVPQTVGALTDGQQTLHQWGIVFYIAIGFYVVTSIFFIAFGSAELQPWGLAPKSEDCVNFSNDENIEGTEYVH